MFTFIPQAVINKVKEVISREDPWSGNEPQLIKKKDLKIEPLPIVEPIN